MAVRGSLLNIVHRWEIFRVEDPVILCVHTGCLCITIHFVCIMYMDNYGEMLPNIS